VIAKVHNRCDVPLRRMLYKLPFVVYAVMNKEHLVAKIETVSLPGWTIYCSDVSYTSRCEVFVAPKTERISCEALEALSDISITVDCFSKYE